MATAKKRQAETRALRAALLGAYTMAGRAARETGSGDKSQKWAPFVIGALMGMSETTPEDVEKAFEGSSS